MSTEARTSELSFSRRWAMPRAETFEIPPIGDFVRRHIGATRVSVDPFARNSLWATWRNDIDPATKAPSHQDAPLFLEKLAAKGIRVGVALLDPPYSPRQVSESYRAAGLKATQADTQNAALMARVRRALRPLLAPGAVVLSFGWNSTGMGKGFELIELMLVAHGGAHNDTICMAERLCDSNVL